jgi:hypothetical protein
MAATATPLIFLFPVIHYKKYDFLQQLFLLQVAGKTILGSFASDL